jgi:hypothetical protein
VAWYRLTTRSKVSIFLSEWVKFGLEVSDWNAILDLPKGDRRRVRSEAKARMRSTTAPDTLGATV